jgi:AcrR family transcriptional regulator
MTGTRRYEQKRRAEQVGGTRRRIVEATVELHRDVGPACTTIAEIARRAGVQRRTVYNHFPDDGALFAACSAHWRMLHPPPDPRSWVEIGETGTRVVTVLRSLYGWYRETEPMTANVLRDADVLPALREVIEPGLGRYLDGVRGLLVDAIGAVAARRDQVVAAASVVVDFHVWQKLAALGDDAAAELAAQFLAAAASEDAPQPGRPHVPSRQDPDGYKVELIDRSGT